MRLNKWFTAGTLIALVLTSGPFALLTPRAQEHSAVPREQWQRVDEILVAMGVAEGSVVADVGAGSGFFTRHLSKAVGPRGRVYAVDVNPVSLRELKAGLGDTVTNVEIVRGEENDPRLPSGQLDAALVVNAYHEFAFRDAMLAAIFKALKPGGRLALVEPAPTRVADKSREDQAKRHSIAIEFVEEDLRQAGFVITRREPAFTSRPEHAHGSGAEKETIKAVEWLIVAERPRATGLQRAAFLPITLRDTNHQR